MVPKTVVPLEDKPGRRADPPPAGHSGRAGTTCRKPTPTPTFPAEVLEQLRFGLLMRVLAIDPGTLRMGYAVLDADTVGGSPEADDYGVMRAASLQCPMEAAALPTAYSYPEHDSRFPARMPSRWKTPSWAGANAAFAKSALAYRPGPGRCADWRGQPGRIPVRRYPPAAVKMAVSRLRAKLPKQQVQQIASIYGWR